jgi:small-conductance mechanosensitive channel
MPRLSEFAKEKKAGLRIVLLQVVVAWVLAAIAYFYSSSFSVASAALWGALTAALTGVSLIRGLSKIEKIQNYQPHSILRDMYRNSMERYFLVIVSLSIAMGILKLSPVAVLCGLVVGQVVPIMARILMIKR